MIRLKCNVNGFHASFFAALVAAWAIAGPARGANLIANYAFDGNFASSVAGAPTGVEAGSGAALSFVAGHDGTVGGALSFIGTSRYLDMSTSGLPNSGLGLAEGTIAFWIRSDGTSLSTQTVMGTANTGTTTGFIIDLNSSNNADRLRLWGRAQSGGAASEFASESWMGLPWDNGDWHHLAFTWSTPDTSKMNVYFDGIPQVLDGSSRPGTTNHSPWQFPMYIGALNNRGTTASVLDAELDEMKIYSDLLSDAEVAALAGATILPSSSVAFEAESFVSSTGSGFNVLADPQANGSQYINAVEEVALASPPVDTATYDVTFDEPGEYALYVRMMVEESVVGSGDPSGINDSMFFADELGASPAGFTVINALNAVSDGTEYVWLNVNAAGLASGTLSPTGAHASGMLPQLYSASAGTTQFVIGGREDGLRLDTFVFSTDLDLTPDELDAIVAVPEPSAGLLAVACLAILPFFKRRRARARA